MRSKQLVFFLFVYLPFYLPLRTLSSVNVVYVQDIITAILCLCIFYKGQFIVHKSQKGIDVSMCFFLLYSIALIFILSPLKGGLSVIPKHIHTFIPGICMFFFVRYCLHKKDLEVLLNLYIYTSILIAFLYVYEWINVNVLGNLMFSWVTKYNEDFGGAEQFLSQGTLGFHRLMGVIGYNHATGIFIAGALSIVYTKYQESVGKLNIPIMVLFFSAIFLTASRTAILSILIIFLINGSSRILRDKLKLLFMVFLFFSVSYFLYRNFIASAEITMLFKLLAGSFSGSDGGDASIWQVFANVFFRDIEQIMLIVKEYPLALLFGAGFPVYLQGQFLNPVLTNDTYFMMWITQYGLLGSLIMLVVLISVFNGLSRVIKLASLAAHDKVIALSTYRVLLIYLFSTVHSSSIQFYPIYFFFFAFLGLACHMIPNGVFNNSCDVKNIEC